MDNMPSLPAVTGADDGDVAVLYSSRALANAARAVFHIIGGVDEMANWARNNRSDYYTKILPRLLPKEVQIDDKRNNDDIVNQLASEIVDTPFTEVTESAVDAEYYD